MALGDGTAGRALSEVVAEEIHRRILAGETPVGSWLRQDAVAAEFDVSRTPVREAFRILGGQGVLQIVAHRGALVRGSTPRLIRESHEVRAELEGFAAELATQRIHPTQLSSLHDAVEVFDEIAARASDPNADRTALAREWAENNGRFHSVILDAAENLSLNASVIELRRKVPHNVTFAAIAGNQRQIEFNAADHRRIYEAIEANEGAKARRLLRQHILRAGELIIRRFETDLAQAERVGDGALLRRSS